MDQVNRQMAMARNQLTNSLHFRMAVLNPATIKDKAIHQITTKGKIINRTRTVLLLTNTLQVTLQLL